LKVYCGEILFGQFSAQKFKRFHHKKFSAKNSPHKISIRRFAGNSPLTIYRRIAAPAQFTVPNSPQKILLDEFLILLDYC
jgi:hypothetical protein